MLAFKWYFFGWDIDCYLVNVYIKPQYSSRNDLNDDLCPFDKLFNFLSVSCNDGSGILLTGDLNAHCGNTESNEFLMEEDFDTCIKHCFSDITSIDILKANVFNLNEFELYDTSVNRKSEDKKVNGYGTKLCNLCRTAGLIFLNGRKGEDRNMGKCTFYNHLGKSVDDYMVCNKNTLKYISNFKVHDINIWSDHCIISCEMNCNVINEQPLQNNKPPSLKSKWNPDKKHTYVRNINSDDFSQELNNIIDLLQTTEDKIYIDKLILDISKVICKAGGEHMKIHYHKNIVQKNVKKQGSK